MGRSFTFPVYQVDFTAVAAGKRVASTKRRIRWRFGFPNLQALEAGRSGTDCRGEEHEVVIVWSVTSGKRQILMDGREVHFSSNRVGLLDYSWTSKGNHVLKVLCHAAPPMQATPGFRQYDLFIDGQSFFTMPKMFELGVKSAQDNRVPGQRGDYGHHSGGGVAYPGAGYGSSPRGVSVKAPSTPAEEDQDLRKAIEASLAESKRHLGEGGGAPAPVNTNGGGDLLDFEAPYAPAVTPAATTSVPAITTNASMNSFTSAPQPVSDPSYAQPPRNYQPALPSPAYSAPVRKQSHELVPASPAHTAPPYGGQQFAALPASTSYGSAPTPTAHRAPPQSFAPSPTQYGAPPPASYAPQPPTPTNYAPPPQATGYPPQANGFGGPVEDPFAPKPPSRSSVADDILKAYTPAPNGGAPPGHYQPGQPFPTNGGAPPQNGVHHQNPAESPQAQSLSMNGLAITEKGDEPKNPFDAAMSKLVNFDNIDQPAEEQLKLTMKKQQDEKERKNRNKSVPIPPAARNKVGSGATLREISQVKPPTPKESVMKPPAGLFQGDAAASGALVVHGQGPPPLQPRGFGVVHMQGQYPQGYR